jgi:hypothetical protein
VGGDLLRLLESRDPHLAESAAGDPQTLGPRGQAPGRCLFSPVHRVPISAVRMLNR